MEKGQLRVWWIPQVPMDSFNIEVKSLEEANLLLETLAAYDDFQFRNKVKPDYSNTGGLQIWDDVDGEGNYYWTDWNDEETGMDFDEYRREKLQAYKYEKGEVKQVEGVV